MSYQQYAEILTYAREALVEKRQYDAALKAKRQAAMAKARAARGKKPKVKVLYQMQSQQTTIPSSWIQEVLYDSQSFECLIKTKRGDILGPYTVSPFALRRLLIGQAICTTDDPTGKNRWFHGKTPSLGAYYNQYLKGLKTVQIVP